MSAAEPWSARSPAERVGLVLLGLGYVGTGLALFYGLATDSMGLFTAALAGTLVLVVVSLGVSFRLEGVATRENGVIGVSVLLAMGLLFGLATLTELPSTAVVGVVVVVGAIVPGLVLRYTDYGTTD